MNALPLDLVNKVLVDVNQELRDKIKELKKELEKSKDREEQLQQVADDATDYVTAHGGVCCEQCGFWSMEDEVQYHNNYEEHLCGECFDMMNHDATFAEAHDAAFEDPRGHGSG